MPLGTFVQSIGGGGGVEGGLGVVDRHGRRTLAAGGLQAPGGVVAGPGGTAYVTNRSVSADGGQLLRVRLPR